jgi:hypothetical protein
VKSTLIAIVIATVAIVAALMILTSIASAGTVKVRDNLYRWVEIEEPDAEVRGLSFTALSVAENRAMQHETNPLGHNRIALDFEIVFGQNQQTIVGGGLLWVPTSWFKFGISAITPAADDATVFSLPVVFYLFPDPFTAAKPLVSFNLVSYRSTTTQEYGEKGWAFDPGAAFGLEIPMGLYAVRVEAGASVIFDDATAEGVDPFAAGTVVFRLGR